MTEKTIKQFEDAQTRYRAFNYYFQEIGHECHQNWTNSMKQLLKEYPEYIDNFGYIYYSDPDGENTINNAYLHESHQDLSHQDLSHQDFSKEDITKEDLPEKEEILQEISQKEDSSIKEWVNMNEDIKDMIKLDEFMALNKKYEDLSLEYDGLLDDYENLEELRNTLEKNYKQTLVNFENQKEQYRREREEHKKQFSKIKFINKKLETENNELRSEINYFIRQNKELKEKKEELEEKVNVLEEELSNTNNTLKNTKDYNKKSKKDYESSILKLKTDLKLLEKQKKEIEGFSQCSNMTISNKNKTIEDKDRYIGKLKKRLEEEFHKSMTRNEELGYTKAVLKKVFANLEHYKFRLEALAVDTHLVKIIQEITESKHAGTLQISPIPDFCGNTIYVFHDKELFDNSRNISIPADKILLCTKGFIYLYSNTVYGLVPIFTNCGMLIHIPNAKELFEINSVKDHIIYKKEIETK